MLTRVGRGLVLPVAMFAGPVAAQASGPVDGSFHLTEIPAVRAGSTLAVVLSGDGGWAPFVKGLASRLAERGIAVAGLNLRSYLSTRRTPEEMGDDLGAVIRQYLQKWSLDRVVIVGYSRGAVVAPFVVNRLSTDLKTRVELVAMLGLGWHAGFHVGLTDLLHTTTSARDPAVLPEIEKAHAAGIPLLCVYGDEEKESLCRDGPSGLMETLARSGGHHFDRNASSLADEIVARLR